MVADIEVARVSINNSVALLIKPATYSYTVALD